MHHQHTPDHLSSTVERLSRHWESERTAALAQKETPSPGPRGFAIAISREAGTQGTLVGQRVGQLLGWQVYDHEILERIAQDMGVRAKLLKSVDERRQSWLTETMETFLSAPVRSDWGPPITESAYFHHLVRTVLALGAHGDCVIVGRGAAFILPEASTFRVRLVAPIRDRVAVLSRTLGLNEREASRKVREMDHARNDFIESHLFKDPTEACYYDLIVNMSRFGIEHGAELIAAGLRHLRHDVEMKG